MLAPPCRLCRECHHPLVAADLSHPVAGDSYTPILCTLHASQRALPRSMFIASPIQGPHHPGLARHSFSSDRLLDAHPTTYTPPGMGCDESFRVALVLTLSAPSGASRRVTLYPTTYILPAANSISNVTTLPTSTLLQYFFSICGGCSQNSHPCVWSATGVRGVVSESTEAQDETMSGVVLFASRGWVRRI